MIKSQRIVLRFLFEQQAGVMANTGKSVINASSLIEHAAIIEALFSIPTDIKSVTFLKAGEVASLLRVDTKTLQRKRAQRERWLTANEEIDGIDIASIPFAPASPDIRYAAIEVEHYLRRVRKASGATSSFGLTRSDASRLMGFQVWMSTASPVDDWPFAIARNGRPMDMGAAIALGLTTGRARRLTLRGYAEATAHLAGQDYQNEEKLELERVLSGSANA